jgi:hypothetical protein
MFGDVILAGMVLGVGRALHLFWITAFIAKYNKTDNHCYQAGFYRIRVGIKIHKLSEDRDAFLNISGGMDGLSALAI